MSEKTPFTFREAVLSSLLVHAGVIIVMLLFPDAFTALPRPLPAVRPDPNAPLPVEFLTPPAAPGQMVLADAGSLVSSDPRPEDAPAPANDDPYAVGNNPNRFLAPPVGAEPDPQEGAGGDPDPGPAPGPPVREEPDADPPPEDPGGDADVGEEAAREDRTAEVPAGEEGFQVTREGAGSPGPGDTPAPLPRTTLRDALGEIAGGAPGGAPLRFDNPVGAFAGPGGGLSFDTKGFNWGPYARRIYWIIWKNWTQGWPPAARAGLPGIVTVRFRIYRDGSITDIQVLDPSGTEAFDTCATVALEASSPLPPLPADYQGESEGITARFLYNVDR